MNWKETKPNHTKAKNNETKQSANKTRKHKASLYFFFKFILPIKHLPKSHLYNFFSLQRKFKRNTVDIYFNDYQREWSFALEMEVNAGNSRSNEKQPSECPKFADKGKKPAENDASTSVFVNHAAIAWHENRRRWVADKSQQSRKISKDPVISWSTTYEELLLTNEPFSESIPLPEMVDFLVDIWHDDGLFD